MCITYGCLYLALPVRIHLVGERLFTSTLVAGRIVFIPFSVLIKVSDVTKTLNLDQKKKLIQFLLNVLVFRSDLPCGPLNLD